jgi:hypothetical protein
MTLTPERLAEMQANAENVIANRSIKTGPSGAVMRVNLSHGLAVAIAGNVLDLLAELDLLREELRLREQSQIPVIPKGAQRRIEGLEAELESVRGKAEKLAEALREIGESNPVASVGHAEARRVANCALAEWGDG